MEERKKYSFVESSKKVTFSPTKAPFVQVTYTPEKLYENFIFREVTSNKKIEEERKRVRLFEAENQLHKEKIAQLELEIATITRTLNEQIDMYRKMIKELETEKHNHIIRIEQEFRIEIETILASHEEVSKVQQARQEQLEARIQELLREIESLKGSNRGHEGNISNLQLKNASLQAELKHTKQLLDKSDKAHAHSIEQYKVEIDNLNRTNQSEKNNLKSHYESLLMQRQKQIDKVIRTNKLEQDKAENKRQNDIANKNSELREQRAAFEAEKSGLQQLIDAKESAHNRLMQQYQRDKDKFTSIIGHLQRQIGDMDVTIHQLRQDLVMVEDNNNMLKLDRGAVNQDNSALADEIGRLRTVLMQSSSEMDRFREQFIRMDSERERLKRQFIEIDKELVRTKQLLLQKDEESRGWMDNYFALKARL